MYFYTIVRPRAQSCMQQQQLKLWERQRFFEEVFQHDVDFFFPVSHLQIEHRRPPLGSISSMEVNVDMLEQMDMLDLSDQDTVDVFLSCGTEDNNNVATLLPGMYNFHNYLYQLVAAVFQLGYLMVKLFVQGKDLTLLNSDEDKGRGKEMYSSEKNMLL
uniref:Dysbindin domain containing 2 n=1 Tax=Naja naja TaxID=35670 RepID=A0A8C6VB65_NAJNA